MKKPYEFEDYPKIDGLTPQKAGFSLRLYSDAVVDDMRFAFRDCYALDTKQLKDVIDNHIKAYEDMKQLYKNNPDGHESYDNYFKPPMLRNKTTILKNLKQNEKALLWNISIYDERLTKPEKQQIIELVNTLRKYLKAQLSDKDYTEMIKRDETLCKKITNIVGE